MKKESFTSFMKQVAADLQQSGNLGTAHVYRSSLNAILVFQESESVEFREITPEWLKHFEGSLRARGCSWNTVSTYLRTMRAVYNRAVDLHRAPYVPHLFRSVYTGTRADRRRALDMEDMKKVFARLLQSAASKKMRNCIKASNALSEQLADAHYTDTTIEISPEMQLIIYRHWGPPHIILSVKVQRVAENKNTDKK